MKWWTAEQAFAWGMWRDEARAELCGDGRRGALEPRQLSEVPILADAERQQLLADLLVHGEVSFTPMPESGPAGGFEERGYKHRESGCYVSLRGWRERPDAPLCIHEALHWIPPREEPILDYCAAKSELEQALRDGEVHATGEDSKGEPVDLTPKSWLYAELVLAAECSEMINRRTASQPRVRRLRFLVEEIKALWPDGGFGPGASYPDPSRYQRKRGRPRTPTETHEAMTRTMLERGQSQKDILAILCDVILKERNVSRPAALKAAKAILANASIRNA